jgi:predicted O-methyltransferase YrrM
MDIVDPRIEKYIEDLRGPAEGVRAEMEAMAEESHFPIVGPEVGRYLGITAGSMNAKRVLEMGSGYGYSALWFASFMGEDGKVICTEGSEENRNKGMNFLQRAGLADKIEYHVGNALEIIDRLDGPFDIIFNDVDKEQYPDTIDKAVAKLRSGGLFITDNALWYGKVAEDTPPDKNTVGVLHFNRRLTMHPDLVTAILPIRDGLAVAMKK